ncbi:mitochondrial import inner membrane translocase subunit TIM23-2-like [Lactuca sativa]|uniref:mitochondrial import inner membrane translocase subunit TIM23-2-like n=1 Tax=Lactuca sativa TaxID=4236 RepID=UPI0022AF88AD|nr:mitochondrial import inner membrane translocase subunit TIM23-2-like [Lactuca sativa]
MSYQPRSSNQNESNDHHEKCWLYNPYQDIRVPAQTLYKLPTSLEYLFQEESIAQRRSRRENPTYYTEIVYLSGAVVGVGKGLVEGVKASEAGALYKAAAVAGAIGGITVGLAMPGKHILKRYVPI